MGRPRLKMSLFRGRQGTLELIGATLDTVPDAAIVPAADSTSPPVAPAGPLVAPLAATPSQLPAAAPIEPAVLPVTIPSVSPPKKPAVRSEPSYAGVRPRRG